ncbi:uncharacterized protein LOC129604493 [Betta splendens]|uniref:Uncharacterized protein LOC129604493 n=1 Tax=Betta splendens TaxID=158456 RepID=A0A9W2XZL8_BETSP|nr:uncharacterized protein LOC129604493 [Betta splendens]
MSALVSHTTFWRASQEDRPVSEAADWGRDGEAQGPQSTIKVKEANGTGENRIPLDVRNIQVGDQVLIRVFKRQWNQPRREGPFKVVLTTPTALKVEGKDFWYHLNHCTRHRPPNPPGNLPAPVHAEGDADSTPRSRIPALLPSNGERRSERLKARRQVTQTSQREIPDHAHSNTDFNNATSTVTSPGTAGEGFSVEDAASLAPDHSDVPLHTPAWEGDVSEEPE